MNFLNKPSFSQATMAALRWTAGMAVLVSTVLIGISDASISGNGIGRVTAIASIFVNNREFDISSAAITIEGQVFTEAELDQNRELGLEPILEIGQVAVVQGQFDVDENGFPVGAADEVVITDNLEGPITSIVEDDEQLVVLSQLIVTNPGTIYDLTSGPNSFDGLSTNIRVEISGFPTAEGHVLATRIEQKATGGPDEITGTVSDLNLVDLQFLSFNAQTVNFSGAELINFPIAIPGRPDNSIIDGDVVEARGSVNEGEFIASQLEFQAIINDVSGELGELEGLITDFTSASDFRIANIGVSTGGQTNFVGGGPANLAANTSVEILGQFDANGILAADQVTVRGTRIRIEGPVDSVSSSTLNVVGVPVVIDLMTELKDGSDAHLKPFMLSDFNFGDHAEVRSFKNPAAGTPVIAARVKREDPESDLRLQGFVNSVFDEEFQVQGVAITVNQDTEFANANDEEITATEFFDVLTNGTFVKVNGGQFTGTSITAQQVELALDD